MLVRHANSRFNLRWTQTEEAIAQGLASETAFLEVVSDRDLLDCHLSVLGEEQCREGSSLASQLPGLGTVFVSPMRRALQTAYLLFRDHPNFARIKFVAHPLLRENMHTVCDIPESLDLVKGEFAQKFPSLEILLGSREPWYVQDL